MILCERTDYSAARTETYIYDSGRRLTRITDHKGNSIRYILNTEGERTRVEYRDSSGALVKYSDYEYNAKGLVTRVIEQGSDTEEYLYDKMGNLESYKNGLDQQTVFAYDPLQRVKKKTRISAQDDLVMDYTHGVHNNITGVTDPRTVTTYTNDDLGNRVTETSPDTGLTTYNYDPAGNLILRTDSNGNSISSSYDELNRLQSIHYPDASQDTSFTYDQGTNGTGKLTGVTDSSGGISYQYNIFGQLLSETRVINTLSFQTSYTYNLATGELDTITYPSGLSLSLQRDSNCQVSGISADGVQLATNVNYLPFGPVTSLTLGPLTSTRSFDKRYNLTRIQTGPLDYLYARNSLGQITRISGIDIPASVSELINYDYLSASNRLIDENGNSYTYDSNGNITSDGINTFTYDQSNRLVEVQQNGAPIASYSYNPANQRIVKTTGTSTVFYHYDTSGKLISETDGIGTPLRDYIYLNNEPLAVKIYTNTPGIYYFLNDHLGTPQKLVDSSGTVVWQAVYLHYGKALVTVNTVTNNLRFPGQYFDSETGLHYNWNRYYDPETGRYISADPIGLAGGLNLYGYVGGDPVNWIDPMGLTSCPDIKYHFIYSCIDQHADALEKCKSKCDGECEDIARNTYRNCLEYSHNKCSGDLNGDGKVDKYDEVIWLLTRRLWDLRTPPFTPYPPGYGDEGPGAIDPKNYKIPPQT